jgi:hypothetical protein
MPSSNEPLTSNEESIAFYYYIGQAITEWARVELSLYWLVSACFTKGNRERLAAGFFSIENFRSKLKFVDEIFKAKYHKPRHIKQWESLREDLERLSRVRNHLAHYVVREYAEGRPGRRLALQPRINQPTKFKQIIRKPPSGALCLKQIVHAKRRLEALASAVEFLFYDLLRLKTPYPASLAQADDVPSMASLALLIRAELQMPTPPSRR